MLEKLPLELLEYILSFECVSLVEIDAVSKVSARLRRCWESNELWKTKFRQRWPQLWRQLEAKNPDAIWRDLYKRRNLIHRNLANQIVQMSPLYYEKNELPKSAFVSFEEIISKQRFGYEFVVDELKYILNDEKKHDSLTTKYYAMKVLCHVRRTQLRSVWKEFLASSKRSIENGAVLLAQWFQPFLDFELVLNRRTVSKQLDDIATSCAENVNKLYKDHPLSRINRLPPCNETDHLSESLWSSEHCTHILIALNRTIFQELGFNGCDGDRYYTPENSYINRVLERKTGIPINLCIVYMCVARRLGVVCEPVGYPVHFLLRYMENPTLSSEDRYTYIDVFDKGKFMKWDELSRLAHGFVHCSLQQCVNITPQAVFERMIRNLINASRQGILLLNCLTSALELLLLIRPDDIEHRFLLCRIYIDQNINLTEVMMSIDEARTEERNDDLLEHIRELCEEMIFETRSETKVAEVRERPPDGRIKFAVGMVMVHKQYNYSCVVYGWDERCTASREWISQMEVHRLPRGESQPFYNVLVNDGSTRYAAEENLRYNEQPEFIEHSEVGKHFASFNGIHFVPNEEKRKEYPDDEEELRRYVLSKQ